MSLLLSSASVGGVGSPGSATLTVIDDDTAFSFSSSSFTVNENAGYASITVIRSSSSGSATVQFTTANNTAIADLDYTAIYTDVTFADGIATATVNIPIFDDAIPEPSESLQLSLSLAGDGTIGSPGSATLTISDDDTRISGVVWKDADTDGINDDSINGGPSAGESGLTVELYSSANTLIASTVTATDGAYVFSKPDPGTYYLKFYPPAGIDISPKDQGADDSIDSDVDPVTRVTTAFSLITGSDIDRDIGLEGSLPFVAIAVNQTIMHDDDIILKNAPNPIELLSIVVFQEKQNQAASCNTPLAKILPWIRKANCSCPLSRRHRF